jgi:SAM-dependent methyltransferase
MDEKRYFAAESPDPFERERLGFLRDVADPITTRRLTQLGIECGWHCLDILEDDLETARYDLVHCRMLLQHLADPQRPLERMTAALRPGGWLLIEESDWDSYGAADPVHPAAAEFDRRSRTIFDHLKARRALDPYFGRRVPELVERLGLADVGHEGTTWVSRGAGPGARFSQMSLAIVRGPLVAAGILTDADFDGLHRAYEDRSFCFADMTLFGAWGRRFN